MFLISLLIFKAGCCVYVCPVETKLNEDIQLSDIEDIKYKIWGRDRKVEMRAVMMVVKKNVSEKCTLRRYGKGNQCKTEHAGRNVKTVQCITSCLRQDLGVRRNIGKSRKTHINYLERLIGGNDSIVVLRDFICKEV